MRLKCLFILLACTCIWLSCYNDSGDSGALSEGDDDCTMTALESGSGEGYLVGAGIYDITGPAAELGMMGYAMVEQKTAGIHMRLRSRAFIVVDRQTGKRAAFISADLGQVFQGVRRKVIEKLQARYGTLYTDSNVLISAVHTHSGPGGYSHYALYNLTILGYDEQNFNCIVEGIFQSVVRAHNNLVPGHIYVNQGELADAGWNRSYNAYMNNPADELKQYTANTDRTMTVLKFVADTGEELGMISWFAVHPTSIGNSNRLISGDNKGYASYLFEKWKGADYASSKTFVAAFAQSNSGDVSPNIYWGYPDGVHDFEHMETIGTRQYDKARSLYLDAGEEVTGPVDYRATHVDMSNVAVEPQWVGGKQGIRTAPAAIGMSMIAGSTEDGKGITIISEGMVYNGIAWPKFTLVPELQEAHGEQIILLPTGVMQPYPWTPEVLPLQIVQLGSLAIVAVPFECTTMSGRRIRNTVMTQLQGKGVTRSVIAGLSNAYAGYVATREEYAVQHYEGASTHFGPYTLNAYQQEYNKLAAAMKSGATVPAGPVPRDLSGAQAIKTTGVLFDDKPLFKSFGDVIVNANASYAKGATVQVVFWGGHPKNNLMTQGTYCTVERWNGSSWSTVANDGDPETKYRWARDGVANSKVTIEWKIPPSALAGQYRIRHFGHWKSGWTGSINPYTGTSRTFTVN